ncbi:adhesin [Mycoplasmoides genitalium]
MEYHNLNNQVVKESLEVDTSGSTFDPTKRLQSMGPEKDSSKQGEKLSEAMSSMSSGGATSTRKALKIEVERGSNVNQGELQSNDFAKKPLQHKENSGTEVKLDASGEFGDNKAWKPLLTTEQIKDNRGMGAT